MIQTPLGALSALFFILIHSTAAASFIINEVDYDQPSYDHAEFIELLNTGPDLLDLDNYTLSLINGISGDAYRSFSLTGYQLAANDYFVLCGDSSHVINCDFDTGIGSNLIQNGGTAPDAIALYLGEILIDSISYEGSLTGFVEGAGDKLYDNASEAFTGLSRIPNGYDSDHNNQDFQSSCITPGLANTLSNSHCSYQVPEPASLVLMLIGLITLVVGGYPRV